MTNYFSYLLLGTVASLAVLVFLVHKTNPEVLDNFFYALRGGPKEDSEVQRYKEQYGLYPSWGHMKVLLKRDKWLGRAILGAVVLIVFLAVSCGYGAYMLFFLPLASY